MGEKLPDMTFKKTLKYNKGSNIIPPVNTFSHEVIISLLFDRQIWTEQDASAWWGANSHKFYFLFFFNLWFLDYFPLRFRREWKSSLWEERGINRYKKLNPPYLDGESDLKRKNSREEYLTIPNTIQKEVDKQMKVLKKRGEDERILIKKEDESKFGGKLKNLNKNSLSNRKNNPFSNPFSSSISYNASAV
jgi:hypothetical protein